MILTVLSLLAPMAMGAVVVRLLVPQGLSRLLYLSLSVPVGFGLSSCMAFIWLLVVGRLSRGITAAELLVVLIGTVWLARHRTVPGSPDYNIKSDAKDSALQAFIVQLLAVAFAGALVLAGIQFVLNIRLSPHGSFDAWESWNMKARVLFLSGSQWRQNFKAITDIVPDYPLSLPLTVASIWTTIGNDSTVDPALVAALYLAASIGLLLGGLTEVRSRSQGLIAAALLVGTPFYVHLSYAEYADIPLSCLILATVFLLIAYDSNQHNSRLIVLAGLTAGLACWMKNEGILFSLLLILSYGLTLLMTRGQNVHYRRWVAQLIAGALTPLLALLYFRWKLAGTNSIAQQGLHSMLEKLTTLSRYRVVMHGLWYHLIVNFGDWRLNILLLIGVYVLLFGPNRRHQRKYAAIAALGTICAVVVFYSFVFVMSPYDTYPFDISWYMLVAAQRLFMQIWPSLLFVIFGLVRTPEELSLSEAGPNFA